jgi:protein ImuA
MLDDLRQRVRALERPAVLEESTGAVSLGVPEIDAVLGGGFSRGALHEIAAASEAHLPAAMGFVVGIGRATCRQAIVWVAEDLGLAESGALYGLGLDGCGIPPERLLTVTVAHRRDLLWAMEEALHCRAVGLVIGEMRAGALEGVAVRRLSLAAAETGALALLLRAGPPDDASTAATRWIVGAAPSQGEEPHLTAHLIRNRRGVLGSWILTWSNGDGFATHAQPVAAAARDRPHRAVA